MWPIREPEPHVAELFRRYQAGEPGARRQLQIALYRHRGTRFILDDLVFWLFKRDDVRDEEIGVCPRSMPLWIGNFTPRKENQEHRQPPVASPFRR